MATGDSRRIWPPELRSTIVVQLGDAPSVPRAPVLGGIMQRCEDLRDTDPETSVGDDTMRRFASFVLAAFGGVLAGLTDLACSLVLNCLG